MLKYTLHHRVIGPLRFLQQSLACSGTFLKGEFRHNAEDVRFVRVPDQIAEAPCFFVLIPGQGELVVQPDGRFQERQPVR